MPTLYTSLSSYNNTAEYYLHFIDVRDAEGFVQGLLATKQWCWYLNPNGLDPSAFAHHDRFH